MRKKLRKINSYNKPKLVKQAVKFPYKRVRIDWIDIITEGGWGTVKEFTDMKGLPGGAMGLQGMPAVPGGLPGDMPGTSGVPLMQGSPSAEMTPGSTPQKVGQKKKGGKK